MIKIITVGQVKEKYLKDGIEEYLKRIRKFTNIELIEVKDEGLVEIEKANDIEGERIKKHINPKDYIITLEIDGKMLTSEEFSTKIDKTLIDNSNIVFIIGGSYGISENIKNISNFKLSFSKFTFPHQLFRLILLEQIYRAYKIMNNESYHK